MAGRRKVLLRQDVCWDYDDADVAWGDLMALEPAYP